MSTTTDGVHRLVDMVVEEVSLVDRAANLRRFLIVKRDDTMDDTEETKKTDVPEDSPLGMALAALESLTDIVELLGSTGAENTDPRITALAEQLRTTAEQLLSQAGLSESADGDEAEKTKSLAENIGAAKAAVARLRRGTKPAPKPQEPDDAPKEDDTKKVDLAPITDGLAKLTESFKALSESVTAHAQRLGRVEKQFGLPNSAAPAEPVTKSQPEDVGWPMDLNKPMDRESVDKAVSFHEP
ncbi:MAG: hypothetical protein Q8L48_25465 [Archangium sp.]|nr:hypothetical protein [Archangium sp.]